MQRNQSTYSKNFKPLPDQDKEWILDYLSGGKGVIPYQKIKSWEDLESVPEGAGFSKTEFYSSLKNEITSDEEYENVKTKLESVKTAKTFRVE